MSEQSPLDFEREKWLGDYELRRREIEIKERYQSRSRWSNPIVLAVLAAALAGVGNATVAWLNGIEQRVLKPRGSSKLEAWRKPRQKRRAFLR